MVARDPAIVRSRANYHPDLCRKQEVVSTAFHSFAEDFLRDAVGVNVSCVEKIDSSFQAEIDLTARAIDVGRSNLTEYGTAAKGHGAQAEHRNHQAGLSKLTIFHRFLLTSRVGRLRTSLPGINRGHRFFSTS